MSVGQPQVVHKSNTLGFVLAGLIVGGSMLIAKKMEPAPAPIIVNPGPNVDPQPEPVPADVTGGEAIGKTFGVNYLRGLAVNSKKMMADLGSGMEEREAVAAAKAANKDTRVSESKRIEDFLRQYKGHPDKLAIAAGQLADGYEQAVQGK
jgi:hypothetical protein